VVSSTFKPALTIHSDYLLHELSNLVKLSAAPKAADSLGFAKEEILQPEQVTACLFSLDKRTASSTSKELKVSAEEGIPEEEFGRVAEALYQRTTRLEYARSNSA
jgi:hypothetical protein